MDLKQSIEVNNIISSLKCDDKQAAIKELVSILHENGKISDLTGILNAVMERESIRSTGVGKGFAIPHCKTALVDDVVIAFGICDNPIDFDSVDSEPVKMIALLVSPSAKTGAHIQALAGISRIITSPGVRDRLCEKNNPESGKPWTAEEIYDLIISRA